MKTVDFFTSVSSQQLKENFEKKFESKINLDDYSREQLEDMRNKLRTRVFQQEGSSGFNDLLTNETYQKDQALLKLLNTRIKEMLGEDIKKLKDKMVELSEAKKGVKAPKYKIHSQGTAAKDYDGDGKKESPKAEVWGSRAKAAKKAGKPFGEGAKPDFLDMDKDGNKKEPMKKAVADKKGSTQKKGVTEGSAHGYNVVRWYEKNNDQLKLTKWLKAQAGLPKDAPVYFDDADLVYGEKTIVPNALVDTKLKFNDLLNAVIAASGTSVPGYNYHQDVYRRPGLPGGYGKGKHFGPWKEEYNQEGPAELLRAVEEEINEPGMHLDNLIDVRDGAFGSHKSMLFRSAMNFIGKYIDEVEVAEGDVTDYIMDNNLTSHLKYAAAMLERVLGQAESYQMQNEGWDDMVKANKDRAKEKTTGKFDVKKTATGTQYTRKSSTFTDGGDDADVKKAKAKAKKESVAVEGKDEGKPGKNFAKIAKKAGAKYGSKEAGERVAGAVRNKMKKAGKLEEANLIFKRHVRVVNESLVRLINEDEEGKAKAITAASDMVNDFTSWMQRVGQYQTKAIVELADAIKADFGAQEAETFKQAVAPALAATLEVLTQQREAISNAVAVLAGEAAPTEPMGMEPGAELGGEEPGMEPMEPTEPDMMNEPEVGDEFGAAEGPGTSREVRESKFARKLAESHSIIAKLAK